MHNIRINFISINPIGHIPILRFIVYNFKNWDIKIVSNYINKSYKFSEIAKEKYIHIYNNSDSLSKPTTFQQFKRYIILNYEIFKFIFNKRKINILYSIDYQVISLALIWKHYLNLKFKIVYHQIEMANFNTNLKLNSFLLNEFKKRSDQLDLVIVPEINRLKYLCSNTLINSENAFVFPNSCEKHNEIHERHKILNGIPKDAFIVGHIGNMGINYSYEYLSALEHFRDKDIYFLFVGRQLEEINLYLNEISKSNDKIIFIQEVPHSELKSIYPYLHLGFILYKGVDLNNEFCAPNKLYEYWSYGIPVIAHNLKGLSDLFDNEILGSLIDMSNVYQIVNSINKYLENSSFSRNELKILFDKKYSINNYLPQLNNRINSIFIQ